MPTQKVGIVQPESAAFPSSVQYSGVMKGGLLPPVASFTDDPSTESVNNPAADSQKVVMLARSTCNARETTCNVSNGTLLGTSSGSKKECSSHFFQIYFAYLSEFSLLYPSDVLRDKFIYWFSSPQRSTQAQKHEIAHKNWYLRFFLQIYLLFLY